MKLLDNKIFFPLAALLAVAMIALSLVWPQGLGTRSPGIFGHAVQYPDYYRMAREKTVREKREAIERANRHTEPAASADAASAGDTSTDSNLDN